VRIRDLIFSLIVKRSTKRVSKNVLVMMLGYWRSMCLRLIRVVRLERTGEFHAVVP